MEHTSRQRDFYSAAYGTGADIVNGNQGEDKKGERNQGVCSTGSRGVYQETQPLFMMPRKADKNHREPNLPVAKRISAIHLFLSRVMKDCVLLFCLVKAVQGFFKEVLIRATQFDGMANYLHGLFFFALLPEYLREIIER